MDYQRHPSPDGVLEVVKRYTRTFLCVARERSFLKAAQKLHITQSAVSQKMTALESCLGVKLFDRSTRPLTFTNQAKYLLQILQKQDLELNEAIQSIQLNSHCLPVIRFGMIESMSDCIGLALIQALTSQTQKVVHIVGTADLLLNQLRRDEVDIIITTGDLNEEKDLQKIEEQKCLYDSCGITSKRPWIFLISDGEPTDYDWEIIAEKCRQAQINKKVVIHAVGTQGANLEKLAKFSTISPKRLTGLKFTEFFLWLSRSVSCVSKAAPNVPDLLEDTGDWNEEEQF